MGPDRLLHQSLHPSVRPLLDPEYVVVHDTYTKHIVLDDQKIRYKYARTDESLPSRGAESTSDGKAQAFGLPLCSVRGTCVHPSGFERRRRELPGFSGTLGLGRGGVCGVDEQSEWDCS